MLSKQGIVVLFFVAIAWIGFIVYGYSENYKCDIRLIDECSRNGGLN